MLLTNSHHLYAVRDPFWWFLPPKSSVCFDNVNSLFWWQKPYLSIAIVNVYKCYPRDFWHLPSWKSSIERRHEISLIIFPRTTQVLSISFSTYIYRRVNCPIALFEVDEMCQKIVNFKPTTMLSWFNHHKKTSKCHVFCHLRGRASVLPHQSSSRRSFFQMTSPGASPGSRQTYGTLRAFKS